MLIGEASRITGLSIRTIQLYEKKGLITVPYVTSGWSSHPNYTDALIERLFLIKKCEGLGFPLPEVHTILELIDIQAETCGKMTEQVTQQIAALEARISDLEKVRGLIAERVEAAWRDCPQEEAKEGS